MLDNCGASDSDLALVVEGLGELRKAKMIAIKNMEVGPRCLEALTVLLQRHTPWNLEELRLEKCKISNGTMQSLLQTIGSHSHLLTLSITAHQFSEQNLQLLRKSIKASRHLTNLDLSYCKITPLSFLPVL